MFSPLVFLRLALIAMPLFSVVSTARLFIETIEFPGQVPDFPEGPAMVNMFSFKPVNRIKGSWFTDFKKFWGMSKTTRVAMDPGRPQTHVPYYSFYKNAHHFRNEYYTKNGNQIEELAQKVLLLIDTLDYISVPQNIWLNKESKLVQECQEFAYHTLLEPKKLRDLERYWVIGIWVALEKGKKEDIHSEIEIPKDFNKQIYLEILAYLHNSPAITQAFDHWVNQKPVRVRAFGGGLEESLKRAALIGYHEDKRAGQPPHPIETLVSEYLTAAELPQEIDQVSGLLDRFREMFKNIEFEVQSSEGQYTISIFKHIRNFQSSQTINESLHRALQEEDFWVDLHTFVAKYEVVQYSKRLKRFLSNRKLKSNKELDLYSILKDPLQEHINLNDAITQLVLKLKTISKDQLGYAYKLIMAHVFLKPTLEREILSQNTWNVVGGLQRAWALIYPGLELPRVGIMDYQYYIFVKYPQLLAHAKWNAFMNDARYVSLDFSKHAKRETLWNTPEVPYDVSSYTEAYYRQIATTMKGSRAKKVLYTMGLEMLMHLNDLPDGQEYLLKMLEEDEFRGWVNYAIRYVRTHNRYQWNFWPTLFTENIKLRQFVNALNEIISFQRHQQDYAEVLKKWMTDWPIRPIVSMSIGRRVFSFDPEYWKGARTPWD
ncbi:uncharacterized protein MELLADRAFT_103205 [Melampsora larici-populina 98AG31]|uniref:Secreted protein n=1 Tax=Melampsora larici-populina (strain 98AG31 / pathotype 3-4-7) TaxID=747676 RepID=F4RAW6_MELLP|nr:uncharacterized protein MELLADRAFT_103205 [Melampsora larici-populina 98AG31]EGG10546.1 hypothetical protein MELLADRAFT_103205 [Melampsora larici-populina 98AG31]